MLPMLCPRCSHSEHRAVSTNSKPTDQIVRQRVCLGCRHVWFTSEMVVPSYAVGWSESHGRKPVLRIPMELYAGHTRLRISHQEAEDQLEALARGRRILSKRADERHRVKGCDKPGA